MSRHVKLNHVHELVTGLSYPLSNEAAREEFDDVTLVFADGEEPLPDILARSHEERFDSVDDIEAEIFSNVPIEAVGEPGQAEGEG